MKKSNMIPLREQNLTNRFLFESDRIHKIHERVSKVRLNEEMGVKFMRAYEEKIYDREDGRKEGLEEGLAQGLKQGSLNKLLSLITQKLEKGKSIEAIADALEESTETITKLIQEHLQTSEV